MHLRCVHESHSDVGLALLSQKVLTLAISDLDMLHTHPISLTQRVQVHNNQAFGFWVVELIGFRLWG